MNNTKKLIVFLTAIASVAFSGCNKSEDSKPQIQTTTARTTTTTTVPEESIVIRDNFEFSQEVAGGTLENGTIWKIDEYGLLVISGTGTVGDFSQGSDTPWYPHRDSILYAKIESGITEIGASVFCECTQLREIRIDGAISKIGNYAFQNCTSLKKISANGNISSIGISAFENCYTLQETNVDCEPETIGKCAFKNCVSLTESPSLKKLTVIEDYTFSGCSVMQFDGIPATVTQISRGAFENCERLTAVTIPTEITEIPETAFAGSGICEIEIPGNITKIGISAFAGCENLESVEFSDGLTDIEMGAFTDCTSLESVIIPQTVEFIDSNAFAHCTSLTSIDVADENGYYESIDGALYTENLRTLKQYPLGNGKTEFVLPSSVTAIEPGALYGKSSLENVSVESGGWSYRAENGVLYAGDFDEIVYYPYCKTNETFEASEYTTSVGIYAFYGNSHLKEIIFPESISSIGGCAFADCENLEKINLPVTISQIGKNAFYQTKISGEFSFNNGLEYYPNSFNENCTVIILPEAE